MAVTDPDLLVIDPNTDGSGGVESPTTANALAVRLPAGTKTIVAAAFRDVANVEHAVKEGWVRTVAGLKRFFNALAVTISTLTISGARNNSGTVLVTTGSVTVSATGGAPPYSYLWTRTDGGGHSWTIVNPTLRTTAFKTNVAAHTAEIATFVCTVTDALGRSVVSDTVTATASNG